MYSSGMPSAADSNFENLQYNARDAAFQYYDNTRNRSLQEVE